MTPEELRKRTADFAADVALFAKPLFNRPETRSAAGQLTDAASSVAANYRVAGRSRSRAEFASKIAIVLEEADESAYWLEYLMRTADVDIDTARQLHGEALELVALFSASMRTLKQSPPRPQPAGHRKTRDS